VMLGNPLQPFASFFLRSSHSPARGKLAPAGRARRRRSPLHRRPAVLLGPRVVPPVARGAVDDAERPLVSPWLPLHGARHDAESTALVCTPTPMLILLHNF
jgi:hypothetical protein